MKKGPETVEQWRERNAHRLICCRWGGKITPEACRSYQTRAERYVLHFNGEAAPLLRVNADYLRCFDPDPCPHLMDDQEVRAIQNEAVPMDSDAFSKRRIDTKRAREKEHLTNPDTMLWEPNFNRSLLVR